MNFSSADTSTVTAVKKRAVRQKKRASKTSSNRQSSTRTSFRYDDMDDTAFQAVQSGGISRQGYELDGFVVDSENFSELKHQQRQRQQNLSCLPASSIPDPDFGVVREVNVRSRKSMDKPSEQKFHSINAPISRVSKNLAEDFQEQCYDELRKARNDVRYGL